MGELLPAVPTTPNNVTDSWQPLVDSNVMSSYGMNKVTLTEWSTSTVIPAIAQGSAIDIDGSTARFVTTEAIGGAPANGTVYVMFIVSGSTVTAELTATAPTWDNTKGGWYGATGNRYSGHLMTKNGTSYTNKGRYRDESDGEQLIIEANRGIDTNTIDASQANLASVDIDGGTATLSALTVTGGVNTDNKTIKQKYFSESVGANNTAYVPMGIGTPSSEKFISVTLGYKFQPGGNGVWAADELSVYTENDTTNPNTIRLVNNENVTMEYRYILSYTDDGA